MIQTINEVVYGDRDEKSGRILIEVRPLGTTRLGTEYLVNDWDITNVNNPVIYKSKKVFYDNAKIDFLDDYIESNFSGLLVDLSKSQKEWKKMQIALMLDTQTNLFNTGNTIYSLSPSDWEFNNEIIIE